VVVTSCNPSACTGRKSTFLNPSPDRPFGIRKVKEGIWLVRLVRYDLGYIDLKEKTLQPVDNPFRPPPRPAPAPAESHSLKAPGETEASNAGEQLAKG